MMITSRELWMVLLLMYLLIACECDIMSSNQDTSSNMNYLVVSNNSKIINKWKVIELLYKIMDIIFSPVISIEMIVQLKLIVEEHHS